MFLVLGPEVLGYRTLRLQSQNSAGVRMQPYPRALDLVWPGHLHGTGPLSARAMDTGFHTVVWRLCLGLSFALTPPILARIFGGCGCASPPGGTPNNEGAAHRQNVRCRRNATGTSGTDTTRPPRPNASDGWTTRPLGGENHGIPNKVLATTQRPHARTCRNRANTKEHVRQQNEVGGSLQRPNTADRAHTDHRTTPDEPRSARSPQWSQQFTTITTMFRKRQKMDFNTIFFHLTWTLYYYECR